MGLPEGEVVAVRARVAPWIAMPAVIGLASRMLVDRPLSGAASEVEGHVLFVTQAVAEGQLGLGQLAAEVGEVGR